MRFRRTIVGICLIAGPAVLLIAGLVEPEGSLSDDTGEYLAALADDPGRAQVFTILFYLGFLLLVPGIFGIIHLLRHRAVVLGHIGGALAVLGLVTVAGAVLTTFYDLALAESANRQEAIAIYDASEDDYVGVQIVFIVAFLAGLTIGFVLLGLALRRARIAPVWVPAAIVAGLVVVNMSGSVIVGAIGTALPLAAFGYVGVHVLRMSDEEWARPPARDALEGQAAPSA